MIMSVCNLLELRILIVEEEAIDLLLKVEWLHIALHVICEGFVSRIKPFCTLG